VAALAVVLLVLWACARLLRRSGAHRSDLVEVLGRQQLSRTSSVTVVRVADRAYVLGVTEGRIDLVAEHDLDELKAAQPEPASERRTKLAAVPDTGSALETPLQAASSAAAQPGGRLAGSALSPATWRSGFHELRERTVRRA
jgi:flagellar protein FliO/FliZ